MTDEILKILLLDRTTGENILWANAEFGAQKILPAQIESIIPRWKKIRAQQKLRTKVRAEIFTPPEVCKLQNNLLVGDERDWQNYVDAKFLEITCGEAPYITSRYNAVTGEEIPPAERYGLLDKKLRVIDNETSAPLDRIKQTVRAVQSVYGYELQGDNLFLARQNIFMTAEEFLSGKVSAAELKKILPHIAEIISWNFWQMDGLTGSPPFTENANLFGGANCRIKDWRTNKIVEFKALVGGSRR